MSKSKRKFWAGNPGKPLNGQNQKENFASFFHKTDHFYIGIRDSENKMLPWTN